MNWTSWGRLNWMNTPLEPFKPNQFLTSNGLAIGNLRSYGDSCMPSQGNAISMLRWDFFLDWNPENGHLKACSGMLLETILERCVPDGWFLPVTPGTKFVTIGGAIANDIHGKNHHCVGNFGHFVLELSLLRSSGEVLVCSRNQNQDMFYATIGGLGLTGVILDATIQMHPIKSSDVAVEVIPFWGLEEFKAINKTAQASTYSVAWLDCVSQERGKAIAKGHFMKGEHCTQGELRVGTPQSRSIPIDFPKMALNKWTVKAFNTLYFYRHFRPSQFVQHYDPFFYPLDGVLHWNRIYGKRGFYQYQCVVPLTEYDVFQEMLNVIAKSGQASFLAVLKTFGSIPSLGLLSFPKEGVTLCLDFANLGESTLELFKTLDGLVRSVNGRRYPAKDATMSAVDFQKAYPNLELFLKYKDPALNSLFFDRVMND